MSFVAVVSGGMDSVTLLHAMHEFTSEDGIVISFDYGQRHSKELDYARYWAGFFGDEFVRVDLSMLQHILSNSALTNPDWDVPEGHYAAENMKQTVVPNRNMIMLSIAWGLAVNDGAKWVGAGIHAGDHFIYPDCRPAFAVAFQLAARKANEGFGDAGLKLYTPFIHMGKHEIVKQGVQYPDLDYSKTWSCYRGGATHCGKCGTCVERKEAFKLAGVPDPTQYDA